jgi:hypothetical protein
MSFHRRVISCKNELEGAQRKFRIGQTDRTEAENNSSIFSVRLKLHALRDRKF